MKIAIRLVLFLMAASAFGASADLHSRLIPHKGESGDAPENTMSAFRLAVERGFGFECDVALSKDGRVFAFHDKDFSRLTGGACTNTPAELTWDEISRLNVSAYAQFKSSRFSPQHPPLLDEVLSLARDGRYIYVDTGTPEIVPYVKAVFAAQGTATPANTIFISSDRETCRAYKRELPEFKVFWVTTSRHWETQGFPSITADEMIATIRETGADGVDCHYDPATVTAEAVHAVHAAGYEFHVWTIDDPVAAKEALLRGVDSITTNYGERLFAALRNDFADSFTFATWNLGHYSCGKTYPSNISAADMPEYAARYSAFLDRADASIFGTCEDSRFCDAAGTMSARNTIFGRYTGAALEETRPFDYNCIYWTNAICLATGKVVFPQAADTRFYRWARLLVEGHEVMVVETHLDWNITPPGHGDDRRLQIRQLIEDFKDEPCVVIAGDFNTSIMLEDGKTEVNTPEDYEAFREAGYVGAHWGTLATWPAEKPFLTIDNIFARGLSIDDVQVLTDPALSDHSLLRCRLSFTSGNGAATVVGGSVSLPGLCRPTSAAGAEGAFRCAYTPDVLARPRLRGVMSPGGDMGEDDFRTLHEWGATLLRFQMVRDWHGVNGNQDLDEYDRWLEGRLDHFDKVILPLARKYGIMVVLDLHVPPGGYDASHEANMFHDAKFADHFVEIWHRIAKRFKGREGLYGYDLINEPLQDREAAPGCDFQTLMRRAAEAVRAEDPVMPIVIESNHCGSPAYFADLEPLPFVNVIYQFHFYWPWEFTHQRVLGYRMWTVEWPDNSHGWNRAAIDWSLLPVKRFQEKYGARIYAGEFSSVVWAPGAENYLRECISVFEEHGWDWSYHAFREWAGWSVEHEGEDDASLRPSTDNPRKQALLDGFRGR